MFKTLISRLSSVSSLAGQVKTPSIIAKQTFTVCSKNPTLGNLQSTSLFNKILTNWTSPSVVSQRWFGGSKKFFPDYFPTSDKQVAARFFRLHNGLWIRTRAGRRKKLWRKSHRRIHRQREHVFCTRSQCNLLDKMIQPDLRTPKYYVKDPYAPYHNKSLLPYYRAPPKLFYP